jgi:hypothetical protein
MHPDDMTDADKKKNHSCRYCGRRFATQVSMYRHVRQSCKIANSEAGMELLTERTLQEQMTAQSEQLRAVQAQMAEMASLMRGQLVRAEPVDPGPMAAGTVGPAVRCDAAVGSAVAASAIANSTVKATTNNNTTNNTTNNVTNNNIIQIVPWDGERRIHVDIDHVLAALAENSRLREYLGFGDHDLANHDIASPYVGELLLDLVKRGHADPAARNVYLNPRRADQVLVHMRGGRWEVLPLATATRLLCDGVAETVHKIALSYAEARRLPLEAQNALAIAGMLYEERPDAYVDQVKKPMAAHLTNMAPA